LIDCFGPRAIMPAFWRISLGHAAALLVVSVVNVHLIAHRKESLGFSAQGRVRSSGCL
jgi:hypothetical protein